MHVRPFRDGWWHLLLASWVSAAIPAPVHTNHDTFYIPFSVTAGRPDQPAQEGVLHVSGDRGSSWHAYQTQPADSGRFSFRAGADGEFWFAVRLTEKGRPGDLPTGPAAELVVVVDRRPPVIELSVAPDAEGLLMARWSILESHLAKDGLSLETRVDDTSPWTPISVPVSADPAGLVSGSLRIPVPPGSARAVVRATARDLAGNESSVERQAAVPTAGGAPPLPPGSPPAPLLIAHSPAHEGSSKPTATAEALAAPPLPGAPALKPPSAKPTPSPLGSPSTAPPASPSVPPRGPFNPGAPLPGPLGPEAGWSPSSSEAGSAPATPPTGAPAGGPQLASRSRRFQLDYVIENEAPDHVHRVEVWFTSDGGKSWRHYGDDEDRTSPFTAEVPSDGLYGFRLLVQAREGLVSQPPRSGDPADVWVTVDAAPPLAKITAARFGRDAESGRLQIHWDAQDAALAPNPITLLFGEAPQGPWRKIAADLPNTGSYDWAFDDRIPELFYIRLEVRDAAGNLGVDVLNNPIRRDGFEPHGFIRGVRPVQFRWFSR